MVKKISWLYFAGGGIAAIGGIIAFMIDCCTDWCYCEDALEEIELQEDFNVEA